MVAATILAALLSGACGNGSGADERDQASRDAGSAAPTEVATTTTAPPPSSFTLVATGDVLLHSPLWDTAAADAAAAGADGFDFRPLIASVEPIVGDADLAICHAETPVAEPGGPYSGYPSFNVPREILPALAGTGYNACTTASNHTYDQGAEGVDRTLDALDAAGIRHAGSARTPEEAEELTLIEVGDAVVALLSFTYGFNGIPPPNGEDWRSNPIDEARILADAADARAQGADVVVVALHWGDEYRHEPNAQQADMAPRLIRSPDIDLLLGHHAHVVQPIEQIDGEWVVYGMGNMVARHSTPGDPNEEGLLVRFTFTEEADSWSVTEAEFAPLLMVKDRDPKRLVDVAVALADPSTAPDLRTRLELAWQRTVDVVNWRDATDAGLTPIATPP
jgi:poly-gamma-glutamate capsule biosynthesis protein CapA/YwtB (metallophosphatase superfamily)